MNLKFLKRCGAALAAGTLAATAMAAGTLTPVNSGDRPVEIIGHDVRVVINNGFARTEVTQRFRNQNAQTVEAVYAFPVPKSASLSEVSAQVGEQVINGEVLEKKEANRVYGTEKSKGNTAALAEKEEFFDFRFSLANLKPQQEAQIRFVYYQPLPADTGIVSYTYPLEEGNTRDAAAENFWTGNSKVSGKATVSVVVKSAHPLAAIRTPGMRPVSEKLDLANGAAELEYELTEGLEKDFIFHYQLAELPGRLEVVPYRAAADKPGTFMMVLTPGADLRPLDRGADYAFVLDVSGSMDGDKLRTLGAGIAQTLGKMRAEDRFRIITFSNSARDLTGGWIAATPENVKTWAEKAAQLQSEGATNLYAGIVKALENLDADRVSSVVLVTDGVTNTGEVAPDKFHKLLTQKDVRVFGFLMGNSANWPLMRTICDASGGFYAGVSNSDDIIGQIMLAKSKIAYESLHDVKVKISGVKTFDLTNGEVKKLYRGQQLVIFGHYAKGGDAEVTVTARISGRDETYRCRMTFPEQDLDNPELERLWAMGQIEAYEDLTNAGQLPDSEKRQLVRSLGVSYQLVTDETSMVVLSDDAFRQYGVERRNAARVASEQQAQSRRAAAPVKNYRVDSQPENQMFKMNAPRLGGGAIPPVLALAAVAFGIAGVAALRSKK